MSRSLAIGTCFRFVVWRADSRSAVIPPLCDLLYRGCASGTPAFGTPGATLRSREAIGEGTTGAEATGGSDVTATAMLERFGAPTDRLGDSTGVLGGLA